MGYTHYFTQTKNFTKDEWAVIAEDVTTLLGYIQHKCEVPLASWDGELGTKPEIDGSVINFNGVGDHACENFMVARVRTKDEWGGKLGSSFCKTNDEPYDLAVTALLCYLSSVAGNFVVGSDGKGENFVQGLEAARQALPRLANQLDIPMTIMEDDRWINPYPTINTPSYSFGFCVDGRAYLTRIKTGETFAFLTHHEAAEWATSYMEPMNRRYHYSDRDRCLFKPMGSFDQARNASIARQQAKAIAYMLDILGPITKPERMGMKPPAYVRPASMPLMMPDAPFHYDFASLLKEAA